MLFSNEKAQARKAAINKVPEQIILSEVRRMVEEMQALNKKLEETVSLCLVPLLGSQKIDSRGVEFILTCLIAL
jgi:hypothetical protein